MNKIIMLALLLGGIVWAQSAAKHSRLLPNGKAMPQVGGRMHNILKPTSNRQGANCEPYWRCYHGFEDHLGNTYHSVCLALTKLKVCLNKVVHAQPQVRKYCVAEPGTSLEYQTDYWCNLHDGFFKYRLFQKCPYIIQPIPLYEDFSPQQIIDNGRTVLAGAIITLPHPRRSGWEWDHKYTNPSDPVYQALHTIACGNYRLYKHYSGIVDKYCGGYISEAFMTTTTNFSLINHELGLVNWTKTSCKIQQDPLQLAIKLSNVDGFLKQQISYKLGECHPNNVLVRGLYCLVMFHAYSAPYSDLHNYLPSLCKGLKHLHACWRPIVTSCAGNMTKFIDNVIGIHHLICEIDGVGPGEYIDSWAGTLPYDGKCQTEFQYAYIYVASVKFQLDHIGEIISGTLACLTVSLEQVMRNTSQPPTPATALFNQMLSRMEALIEVVVDNIALGVRMDLLPPDGYLAQLFVNFLQWIFHLVALFLAEGGFVNYDRWNPWWWHQLRG